MELNDLIKKYRLLRGYTQKEVADKLGMTHSGYSKYERGERKVDIIKWVEISKILDVPFQYIDGKIDVDYMKYENEQDIENLKRTNYEMIHNVVNVFIENKDRLSNKEIETARELFEDVFYNVEKVKATEKETQKKLIDEKYKPSKLKDAIKEHGVEFLYNKKSKTTK